MSGTGGKRLRGMGRIFKRGPVYWIAYSYRGREYRETSRSTRERDAVRLLKRRLGEIGHGRLVGPIEERLTVEEVLRDLEVDYRIRGRRSVVTLTANLKAVRAIFGNDLVVDVVTPRLRAAIAAWQDDGIANATINRRLAALQRALSLAREAGKLSAVPHFPFLPEQNARQGFYEKGEFLTLLRNLPDDDLRDFVEWAFWTGMRKGEGAKLTWAALDRETWTLRLHGRDAKTGKPRLLALEGPLRAVIERRLAARRPSSAFIFHRDGDAIREFRKSWRQACRTAGLEGRLFHDLRRTGLRNLIRAGVPQSVAMAISGHRTASVFRRYDITNEEDLRAAMRKVSAYVEALPAESSVVPMVHSAAQKSDNFRTTAQRARRVRPITRRNCKWSRGESNPRPLECDSSALPTELRPHTRRDGAGRQAGGQVSPLIEGDPRRQA